jgi:hypothetical protein
MSQPPYPPPDGADPAGQQPGPQSWGPQPGQGAEQSEEPTQQLGQPAPPTAQFPAGQYGQPGGEPDATAQFGQPQYGQPEYGQPQYGQPEYGQPQYGQPQFGQPQYGQPGQPEYGQQPYGQPQYGQPEYGQPPYGQPQYGGPGGPVPPGGPGGYGPGSGGSSGGGSGKLIAIIVAVVVVLAGAGVGLFFLLKDDGGDTTTTSPTTSASTSSSSSSSSSSSGSRPSTTGASPVECEEPSGGGSAGVPAPDSPCDITEDDPEGEFTPLAADCADEDWAACDDLYWGTSVGSDWEAYGSTCGGRNAETSGGCEDLYEGGGTSSSSSSSAPAPSGPIPPATIPPTGLGDDPTLNAGAQACYDGDMRACDDLYFASESGSTYRGYADSCAGRQPQGTGQLCRLTFPG